MRLVILAALGALAALPAGAQQSPATKPAPVQPFIFDAVPFDKLPTGRELNSRLPVEVLTMEEVKADLRNAEPIPAPRPQPNGRKQFGSHDLNYDETHEKYFERLAPGGLPERRP